MSSNRSLVAIRNKESNHRVGQQIKDLRKSKGITQTYLAEKTGRSIGYISQLERGLSSASIPVLKAISEVLGVNITWFFHSEDDASEQENKHIVRRHNRKQLNFSDAGIKEELLSPWMSGDFIMILTTIEPNAETDKKTRNRQGDEGGYVQLGQVELSIGDEKIVLNAGDSFSISDKEDYHFKNLSSTEKVVIIWVLPPSSF